MNRCASRLGAALAFVSAALALAACASAPPWTMAERAFPANALRGEVQFGQPPQAWLNGQPTQLAPGARIRNPDNAVVMSGAVMGQRATVHYTLDALGQLADVWVLRPQEMARPWPRTRQEAQDLTFDPSTQSWNRP